MKILIAEDEQVSARLLQEIMITWGAVDMARDGQTAIDLWLHAIKNGVLYDLICLDIMMPEKTGHQALEQIRELERDYGVGGKEMVPVIMTTVLADKENVLQAFLKGICQAYVVKPITFEKMRDELLRLELITP